MVIKKGDKVKVSYEGTLEDGTIFDKSESSAPLQFEVGSGQLIKGFDEAVIGMEVGQEKTIHLKPDEAYGMPHQELVKNVPKTVLPPGDPKPGMVLLLKTPDGQQFPARVAEVTDKEIKIDLNHPLAGKALNFKIKIVAVN